MPSPETARLMAELALVKLLGELPAGTTAFTVEGRFNGLVGVLRVGTPNDLPLVGAGSSSRQLSPRQQEVYDAARLEIARLGRRVLGCEIRAAMAAAGIRWGVSTVNTALADLVNHKWLVNDNDKRGYGLPDEARDTGRR